MKKHVFRNVCIVTIGVASALICCFFILRWVSTLAWLDGPEKEVVSLDTGETFLLRETLVLGGDGAQHWELYQQNPKKQIGDVYRGEGEEMGLFPVYDTQRPLNIVMYYDPFTDKIYSATKPCWGNVGGLKKFENILLRISGLVPTSFVSGSVYAGGEDGSMAFVMSGDASCYDSYPVHSSIIVNKLKSLVASTPGPVVSAKQLEAYLAVSHEYQPLETVLVGDRVAFLVKRTRNGTVGGPASIYVWIAEGSGPLYQLEFSESMNVDEVKLFLSTLKID